MIKIHEFKTLLQHYCIYGIVHYLLNIYSSFDCYFWNWIWYVGAPILPGVFILLCIANVNWPITSRGCHCSIRLFLSRCLQWKITKSRKSNLFWANIPTSRHSIYIRTVITSKLLACVWSYEQVKVVRILKKRAREMSCSSKVSRTFEFLRVFGAAEKIQAKV